MKTTLKQLILTFTFVVAFMFQLNARILTVANPTTPQVAQYNTLQAAHDAAQSGDTIYLYPGLSHYSGLTVTKKVIIIGSGFNKITDYSDNSKIVGNDTIKFEKGSDGSILSSIIGKFNIKINDNNIFVKKCILNQILEEKNLTDVTIVNCYINNSLTVSENTSSITCNNIFACNNSIIMKQNSTIILKNNVFYKGNGDNGYYPSFIDASTSRTFISICNVFIGYFTSNIYPQDVLSQYSFDIQPNDGRWYENNFHLQVNSPGKNAGPNGSDVSIYSGDYPFDESGAPELPTIYYMSIPSTGSQKDGLSVEIKAKTN